ncbi:MAG: DNA-3-methyladenine glycosylase [Opitutaceae bacterium]|nr:DNA-3-methyladenine glycosylase [Opitutaceae bacterium]
MARLVKAKALRAQNTVAIARGLLGKFLVRATPRGPAAAMITEVEAYDGPHDRASHASRGRTARNAVMFEPGGVWYVYLCYGVHEMLNLVTGPRDYPAAVLIRGVAGASGPGRLTRAFNIDRGFNGAPAAPAGGLWIEDRGVRLARGAIRATPRIGVAYAGPAWAKKPWRFVLTESAAASRSRPPG